MTLRERLNRALYLLLAGASLGSGLWLLAEPAGASAFLQLHATGEGSTPATLRRVGAGYFGAGLALLGCLLAPARARLHAGLLLFFGVLAAVGLGDLLAAGTAAADWPRILWLELATATVLTLMLVRLPTLPFRAAGDSETGVVKWFDARKGFGFITRASGEELFVHYRSIRETPGGQRGLRDGQTVRFRVGQGKKGPQAEDVTPLRKNH